MTWPPVPPIPDLTVLEQQLTDAGITVNGLGMNGWPDDPHVFTYDASGQPAELPSEAQPIVDAFLADAKGTTSAKSSRSSSRSGGGD